MKKYLLTILALAVVTRVSAANEGSCTDRIQGYVDSLISAAQTASVNTSMQEVYSKVTIEQTRQNISEYCTEYGYAGANLDYRKHPFDYYSLPTFERFLAEAIYYHALLETILINERGSLETQTKIIKTKLYESQQWRFARIKQTFWQYQSSLTSSDPDTFTVESFDALFEKYYQYYLSQYDLINGKTPEPKPTPEIKTYSDIEDTPFAESIKTLGSKNIIEGYGDGTFRPNATITRAELLKIIIKARYGNDLKDETASSCYIDIQPKDWYSQYVCFAKAKGIVSGYPDGTFKPNMNVSFAEASKIILVSVQKTFQTTPWYQGYLQFINTSIVDFSALSPSHKMRRGEIAEITRYVLEKLMPSSTTNSTASRSSISM